MSSYTTTYYTPPPLFTTLVSCIIHSHELYPTMTMRHTWAALGGVGGRILAVRDGDSLTAH